MGATNDVTTWRIRVALWIKKRLHASTRMHTPMRLGAPARARAHTHTHTCNTYCFFTATMVSWTRFYVTLYVHCLSCSKFTQRCHAHLEELRYLSHNPITADKSVRFVSRCVITFVVGNSKYWYEWHFIYVSVNIFYGHKRMTIFYNHMCVLFQ